MIILLNFLSGIIFIRMKQVQVVKGNMGLLIYMWVFIFKLYVIFNEFIFKVLVLVIMIYFFVIGFNIKYEYDEIWKMI